MRRYSYDRRIIIIDLEATNYLSRGDKLKHVAHYNATNVRHASACRCGGETIKWFQYLLNEKGPEAVADALRDGDVRVENEDVIDRTYIATTCLHRLQRDV